MSICIRAATQSDNTALVTLASLSPMKGSISLRVERTPDFFALNRERGITEVFVAFNTEDELITGCFSCTKQLCYSLGEPVSVYYLADLKVHPGYVKSRVSYLLVKHMYAYLRSIGADILFCTAVNDNHSVMPFFNGKAGIPLFKRLGIFAIHQLLPRKGKFNLAENTNITLVEEFYKECFKEYGLYPALDRLDACTHFIQRQDNRITSVISTFDPSHLKQNVAVRIPLVLSFFLRILRAAKKILPLPEVPALHQPLKILFVRFFAYTHEHETDFKLLLQKVRAYAYDCQYHLISIAVDERDAATDILLKRKSLARLTSQCLVTSLDNNETLVNNLCKGYGYEDFSLS